MDHDEALHGGDRAADRRDGRPGRLHRQAPPRPTPTRPTATQSTSAPNTAAAAASASPAPDAEPAYVDKASDAVRKVMQENVIPGAVVLISAPDQGEWTGTFGTRTWGTEEPMQAGDHFRIGSNTKTLTSTVILQLAQEGKLSLDDPIDTYIPGVPNGDKITIRNLSEMRSGLFSYSFDTTAQPTRWTSSRRKSGRPRSSSILPSRTPSTPGPVRSSTTATPTSSCSAWSSRSSPGQLLRRRSRSGSSPRSACRTPRCRCRRIQPFPIPHPQGYSFGSNTSTIDTYALSAEDEKRALAGALAAQQRNHGQSVLGMDRRRCDLDRGGHENLRRGAGRRWTARRADAEDQDGQHPGDGTRPCPTSGYGLGIAKFDTLYGHDGQIPGFMTFMGHDPDAGLTIVIGTNLATVPGGEGSALAILKGLDPDLLPERRHSWRPRGRARCNLGPVGRLVR